MPNFNGMWTSRQQMQARGANLWPATPGAPTSVSATAGDAQATVSFTAPTDTGYPAGVTGYRVTASPGGLTATGSSSPITITGLTNGTTYTFTVAAQNANGYGPESAPSASIFLPQTYTTAGTYSFVVPSGVTSVSAAAIGGGGGAYGGSGNAGGGAGGGAFRYVNNISVTPGQTITVTVGAAGTGGLSTTNGGQSSFGSFVVAPGGGRSTGTGGGSGASGGTGSGGNGGNGGPAGGSYGSFRTGGGGGGGAGGISGNGGAGGDANGGNAPYNNSVNGSYSGGSGGFGGGSSGWVGGGVAFATTSISQTSAFSQQNMPYQSTSYPNGVAGYYGGGGGGAYGEAPQVPRPAQGGAVQVKWGSGGTY